MSSVTKFRVYRATSLQGLYQC